MYLGVRVQEKDRGVKRGKREKREGKGWREREKKEEDRVSKTYTVSKIQNLSLSLSLLSPPPRV